MTLNDHINNFLADGQYRIGELTALMDDLGDDGNFRFQEYLRWRLEISAFMNIVYEGRWYITNGFNHVQLTEEAGTEEAWTEREVIAEIERIRFKTEMNIIPGATFIAYYPQITNPIGGGLGGDADLPSGLPGQTLFYNNQGELYAEDISPYGGMLNGELINDFFSGRT